MVDAHVLCVCLHPPPYLHTDYQLTGTHEVAAALSAIQRNLDPRRALSKALRLSRKLLEQARPTAFRNVRPMSVHLSGFLYDAGIKMN